MQNNMTQSQLFLTQELPVIEVQWVNPTTILVWFVDKSTVREDITQRLFNVMIKELQDTFGLKLVNVVVGFNEILFHFDPNSIKHVDDLSIVRKIINKAISLLHKNIQSPLMTEISHHRIGVTFSENYDLPKVAAATERSISQFIDDFCGLTFTVMLNGFMPGFPYMSGLPDNLRLPRLATPRLKVPKGAIAIAEHYCGIYPQVSPGGWYILGTTEHALFDIRQSPPALLQSGDTVQFFSHSSLHHHD